MKKLDKKAVAIVLLSTALVSVMSFSFAWFINNSDVALGSENEFAIETGYSLSISRYLGMVQNPANPENEDDLIESWSEFGVKTSFTSPTLKDITGDGMSFATPYSLITKYNSLNIAIERDAPVFPMYEIKSDEHDRYYIEETLKFRTNMACGIYLSNSSYVLPLNAADDTTYDQTNESIKLEHISSNNIAGAARVAFLERTEPVVEEDPNASSGTGGTSGNSVPGTSGNTSSHSDASTTPTVDVLSDDVLSLKQIWIPNPQFQLKFDSTTLESNDFTLTGIREDSYGYYTNNTEEGHESEGVLHTYTADDYVSKKIVVGNDVLFNSKTSFINRATPLLMFEDDSGEFFEKKLTIRVWIEGTDREANEALNMGKFRLNLNFAGVLKQAPVQEEVDFINGITLNKTTRKLMTADNEAVSNFDEVIYSVNGIDWYDYNSSIPATYSTPSNGVMVNKDINDFYIKLKENSNLSRDLYKHLTFADDPEPVNPDPDPEEGGES